MHTRIQTNDFFDFVSVRKCVRGTLLKQQFSFSKFESIQNWWMTFQRIYVKGGFNHQPWIYTLLSIEFRAYVYVVLFVYYMNYIYEHSICNRERERAQLKALAIVLSSFSSISFFIRVVLLCAKNACAHMHTNTSPCSLTWTLGSAALYLLFCSTFCNVLHLSLPIVQYVQ